MPDLWTNLPVTAQDALTLLAILAPGLALGWVICRGLALRVLLRSLLRSSLWTNLAFVLLVALSVGLGVGLIAQERGLRQASARVAWSGPRSAPPQARGTSPRSPMATAGRDIR